jgi:ELWxxDGT repeat protein
MTTRHDDREQFRRHQASSLGARGRGKERRTARARKGLLPALDMLEGRTLLSSDTVQLVKDVNTVETSASDLVAAGTNLFAFVDDTSKNGQELEVLSAGGTPQALMDFVNGSSTTGQSPTQLTAVGNDLYFLTSPDGDTFSSDFLWMSDGTVAGTTQVNIPNPNSGTFSIIGAVGGKLIVSLNASDTSGDEFSNDYQLWETAPGSTSPTMIADLGASYPSAISTVGDTLYFGVDSNLWQTDGTSAGTKAVVAASALPVPVPDTLFAFDGKTYELTTNGSQTTIGTLGASGITPIVTLSSTAQTPVVDGSKFFFTAGGSAQYGSTPQLWVSDGTAAGTQLLEDFSTVASAVASTASGATPSNLTADDGSLFFTVKGSDGNLDLWKSTGTVAGTVMIKDLAISSSLANYSYGNTSNYSYTLAPLGDSLLFAADDGTHGGELWSDDVATGATQMVADINPGSAGSDPHDFVLFGGEVYFAANNGATPLTSQLWKSDGTSAGTLLAASISPGATGDATSSSALSGGIGTLGDQIFLPLSDGVHGTALWASDGTTAGTTMLAQVNPDGFANLNGAEYFLGTDTDSKEGLWKTNGTASGTTEVKELPGSSSSYSYGGTSLLSAGGRLYFTTQDGASGEDLWISDGTTNGTVVVKDFTKPAGSSYVSVGDLTTFGSGLVFVADDGAHGSQLWTSNGTAGGTIMLTSVDTTPSAGSTYVTGANPASLTVDGGAVYFFANSPESGTNSNTPQALWKSDGTVSGTSEITAFPSSISGGTSGSSYNLADLTLVGNQLDFVLSYNSFESESDQSVAQLWTSDGTAQNTVEVPLPAMDTPSTSISSLENVGGKLLFIAVNDSSVTELFSSNGTAQGTTPIKVLNSSGSTGGYQDYGYSAANQLVANGVLYFSNNDGTHGAELWQSDGTSAGTFMVDDINAGAASSSPIPLAIVNGQLFLIANDGEHGNELMKVVPGTTTVAPGVVPIATQQLTVGETLTLDVSQYAYDANTPALALSYTLGAGAPAGASISPSGLLTFATTSATQTGSVTIPIVISDNGSPAATATESITVEVNAVSSPSLSFIPSQDIGVNHTLTVNISQYASDPNSPPSPLTYSLTGEPAGATINPSTGVLTWTPTSIPVDQSVTFTVTATDNETPPQSQSATVTVYVYSVNAPTFYAIPTQGVNVGQTLTLDLGTYGDDPNTPLLPLTYSLGANPPAGASVDSTTGVLTFTPVADQVGTVSIPIIASDDSSPVMTGMGTVTVDVGAAGTVRAPVLTAPSAAPTVVVGDPLTFYVSSYASDPNTPPLPLTYTLGAGAPAGATINSTTGEISWATTQNQPLAAYSFPVTVTDTSTPAMTATLTYTVDVVPGESLESPSLSVLPGQTVDIGSTLTFNVSKYATDSSGLSLTYSLGLSAPAGATIDATTGVLSWTPTASQAVGTVSIPVIVSDYRTPAGTATASLSVTVQAAGATITPTISTIPQQTALVGQQYTVDLSQFVSNPSQLTLTYGSGFFDPAGVSISASSGMLSWTPTSGETGSQFVSFSVNYGSGSSVSGSFTVHVTTFSPPVMQSIPNQTAIFGEQFSLDIGDFVTDPNAGALPLKYSLSNDGFLSGVSIDPTTGILTWTPSSDGFDSSGSVTVTVSDSESPPSTASQTFTLTGVGLPPTVTPIPAQFATVGQAFSLDLNTYASEPSGQDYGLTYSLGSGAPAGMTISGGAISWTPSSTQQPGMITVPVIVSDTESTPQETPTTFDVTVFAAPTLPPAVTAIPVVATKPGATVDVNVGQHASDPNSPELTLSYALAPGAPAGASINAGSGAFAWAVPSGLTPGLYPITVMVTDNASPALITTAGFTIDVSASTINPPTLSPIPAQTATAGTTFTLNVSLYAADPNTPALPLTYSLSGGSPSGMTIDPMLGVITWAVPANATSGDVSFMVTVSDDSSPPLMASQPISIDVTGMAGGGGGGGGTAPVVKAPVISSIPNQSVSVGQTLGLNLGSFASDPSSPVLPITFSLTPGAPAGVTINPTTGALSWPVAANQQVGVYEIGVKVADNAGNQATTTFAITVTDPTPPMITKATLTTKKGFSITLTFNVPLNPATANNSSNFVLTEPAKKSKNKHKPAPAPTKINLTAIYNASTDTVTLKGPKSVTTSPALTLTVSSAIAKLDGEKLAGNGSPGTDYVASVTNKTVSHTAVVAQNRISVRINARTAGSEQHSATAKMAHPALSRPHANFRAAAHLIHRWMPRA